MMEYDFFTVRERERTRRAIEMMLGELPNGLIVPITGMKPYVQVKLSDRGEEKCIIMGPTEGSEIMIMLGSNGKVTEGLFPYVVTKNGIELFYNKKKFEINTVYDPNF